MYVEDAQWTEVIWWIIWTSFFLASFACYGPWASSVCLMASTPLWIVHKDECWDSETASCIYIFWFFVLNHCVSSSDLGEVKCKIWITNEMYKISINCSKKTQSIGWKQQKYVLTLSVKAKILHHLVFTIQRLRSPNFIQRS